MTKAIRNIALITFILGWSTLANAQFVSFRLEIPAGMNFSGQVAESMEGGTWENSKSKTWIKLETFENLSLLVDVDFPEGEILPLPEAYFLNDGSADFEKAGKLKPGNQELQMISPPKLIRNMNPRPSNFQSWLGLPVLNGIRIKIEYP